MRKPGGFTLVELMVVIAITGILLRMAVLEFHTTMLNRSIEKQARQLLSDLFGARAGAMYSKRQGSVKFQSATCYSFYRYSSLSDAAGTLAGNFPVKYPWSAADGGPVTGFAIVFDREGMASHADGSGLSLPLALMVNPTESGAAADCVIIDAARTSLGRMAHGTCVIK